MNKRAILGYNADMARNKPTTDDLPKYEIVEYNGREARRYPDGSIRDSKGAFMALPPYLPEITTDNARDMIRLREAKRMRLYAAGAQLAVENKQLIERYGEDAHIVERGRTLQEIASTADAGKAAVMAAAHLDKAQGLMDKPADVAAPADAPVTLALVQLLGAITRRLEQGGREVLDAGEDAEAG